MASTILYKFQSGTTFEALPLPGSAARLFDVKKAIVKAKKLDNSGSMEFDLAVRNADTNEEYANESMLLPRGTRLIVQRLPAARGHGFLARMARNEHSGGPVGSTPHQPMLPGSTPSGYYTIDSRARDDDEFVQGGGVADDERELAALQAATSMPTSGPSMTGGYSGGPSRAGGPPRPTAGGGGTGGGGGPPKPSHFRPNADPELREQEKQLMPKKRATGIPRTFLNLNAPPQTDGNKEGDDNVPFLQPNTLGFKELVNRGGGQSENTAGTRRDLEYALKLTSTTVPEHLQCGICNGVVKNPMLLPWDPEGRTACELCIRDALAQNGFRCPLTGMDGVSPDDLIPNVGLRKAAELFIKGVMEKVDEIEQQQVEETVTTEDTTKSTEANVLDGDGVEKGVLVSKKMTLGSRKKDSDDPFGGGDDDFGGDVFAVETEKHDEDEDMAESAVKAIETKKEDTKKDEKASETDISPNKEVEKSNDDKDSAVNEDSKDLANALTVSTDHRPEEKAEITPKKATETPSHNRRERRRRGPPVGYTMGPARAATGARVIVPPQDDGHGKGRGSGGDFPPGGRGGSGFRGGGFREGRGGRGRGRFGSMEPDRNGTDGYDDDAASRGTKRSYDDHMIDDPSPRESSHRQFPGRYDRNDERFDDREGGRGPRDFGRDDRGPRGGGGGYRGGGRGGGFRGRGGFRGGGGGGGRSYGRGRY